MYDWPTVLALEPISALWPSIIVAIVVAIYRKTTDRIFESTAIYYAHQQILKAKPKFLTELLNNYKSKITNTSTNEANGATNGATNGELRQRKVEKTSSNTETINEMEEEFDKICKTEKLIKAYEFFNSRDIELLKPQRRAIKSYHKAFSLIILFCIMIIYEL